MGTIPFKGFDSAVWERDAVIATEKEAGDLWSYNWNFNLPSEPVRPKATVKQGKSKISFSFQADSMVLEAEKILMLEQYLN